MDKSQSESKNRTAFNTLTGKPSGKGLLGRPNRRCEDNIRMDLKQIGVKTSNWVHLTGYGFLAESIIQNGDQWPVTNQQLIFRHLRNFCEFVKSMNLQNNSKQQE